MSGNFVINGSKTTIKLQYTSTTGNVQNVVGDAAEYLWNKGRGDHGTEKSPIVFADLTNQQKLDIVSDHIKQVIIDLANTHKSVVAQDAARKTEAESEYSL